jgi:hypothetical protein
MCAPRAVHIRRAREYSRQQYMQFADEAAPEPAVARTIWRRPPSNAMIAMMSDLRIGSPSETRVTLIADALNCHRLRRASGSSADEAVQPLDAKQFACRA